MDPRKPKSIHPASGYEFQSEELIKQCGPYRVRISHRKNTRSGKTINFLHIDSYNWAVIFALTKSKELVMVRQYRNAAEEFSLEPPGGCIEDGEDAATGVQRELLEETGYKAATVEYIGSLSPNPAMYTNTISYYFARDVEKVQGLTPDEGESLEMVIVPFKEAVQRAFTGSKEFIHSMHVAGLGMLLHKYPELNPG